MLDARLGAAAARLAQRLADIRRMRAQASDAAFAVLAGLRLRSLEEGQPPAFAQHLWQLARHRAATGGVHACLELLRGSTGQTHGDEEAMAVALHFWQQYGPRGVPPLWPDYPAPDDDAQAWAHLARALAAHCLREG